MDAYIQEGYFHDDGALYLFPVAKSTEITMINTTEWQPFANATGVTLDQLSTTEGIVDVARQYYEWTDSLTPDVPDDGKAFYFYGRDSMSNYFIIGMKQMGIDIFDVENGEVTLRPEKEQIRRLWDNYYVPYINSWFASLGKFRSDDAKTGDILAYTGSSSSSMYFPDHVVLDDSSRPIGYTVLPTPVMDGLAATHAIRTLPRKDSAAVPIVAVSANAFDEDIKRSLASGMNAHLSKPIEVQKLRELLRQLTSNA